MSIGLGIGLRIGGRGSNAPEPIMTLAGEPPTYSATPLAGETIDTNLVISDAADFTPLPGTTVASVANLVNVRTGPTVSAEFLYNAPEAEPFEIGDRAVPTALVTNDLGRTIRFSGPEIQIALPAPTVTEQPVLTALVLSGATSFTVDFGSASPIGVSGWLGDYSPVLTRTLTINGISVIGALTLISGTLYQWDGAALSTGDVIVARASWANATGTTLSSEVTTTVAIGFSLSRDDLTYEAIMQGADGVVTGTVTSPEPYASHAGPSGAGTFSFDADDTASGPVVMFPAVIDDNGTLYSVTQTALWGYAGTSFTQGGAWYKNGTATGGTDPASGPTIASLTGGDAIKWVATATDSNGTETSDSNTDVRPGGAKTLTEIGTILARSVTVGSGANNDITGYDFTGLTAGDQVVIRLGIRAASAARFTNLQIIGDTTATADPLRLEDTGTVAVKAGVWTCAVPANPTTIRLVVTGAGTDHAAVKLAKVVNASATAITTGGATTSGVTTIPGDLNVTSGDLVFAALAIASSTPTPTFPGLTNVFTVGVANAHFAFASEQAASTETPTNASASLTTARASALATVTI